MVIMTGDEVKRRSNVPTESIIHNFVISDPAAVERFVNALEESERGKQRSPTRDKDIVLRDPEKIRQLMAKRQNKH